jgi:hypothetical protein
MTTPFTKLNILVNKADHLYGCMEDGCDFWSGNTEDMVKDVKEHLDNTINVLESMGAQVEGVTYKKSAIWLGYDIPLALDVIIEDIHPILENYGMERIEFEGDTMHVIKGELDVQFIQGIIAAFTKIHQDGDDFNITYEVVEIDE